MMHFTNPTIVLHEETLQQHANGTITGIVLWQVNGQAFPDDAWNDFVIVVLVWWTEAIIRLLNGTSAVETMDLVDGPYSIVCKSSYDSVRCHFIDRRNEEKVVTEWSGRTDDLAEAILDAGKTALRMFHQRSWVNPDIKTLEREVNTLRKLI